MYHDCDAYKEYDNNVVQSEWYGLIWSYGDLSFVGEKANPIQVDTWVQVQSVNESKLKIILY